MVGRSFSPGLAGGLLKAARQPRGKLKIPAAVFRPRYGILAAPAGRAVTAPSGSQNDPLSNLAPNLYQVKGALTILTQAC
ncbi:hypothetical protein NDU88_009906 [Pleurodeles waltl]|uniref:Uncharacterized protein n=1 Tax=Pleurodeles waltl TaxID=8319 RepID=A0AAV7QYV8_PLEWA|nr:hypothetical protein NDU88_009906 [Pleurodeles waltl]